MQGKQAKHPCSTRTVCTLSVLGEGALQGGAMKLKVHEMHGHGIFRVVKKRLTWVSLGTGKHGYPSGIKCLAVPVRLVPSTVHPGPDGWPGSAWLGLRLLRTCYHLCTALWHLS